MAPPVLTDAQMESLGVVVIAIAAAFAGWALIAAWLNRKNGDTGYDG